MLGVHALGGLEVVTAGLVHELIADAELTPAILLINRFVVKSVKELLTPRHTRNINCYTRWNFLAQIDFGIAKQKTSIKERSMKIETRPMEKWLAPFLLVDAVAYSSAAIVTVNPAALTSGSK